MRIFGTTIAVGDREGEIKGKTVGEVINNLCNIKGTEFRESLFEPGSCHVRDEYVVLVNGKPIDPLQELNRKVKRGDTIAILPALGGG
jgi:molybdopterin converting factor small subunit